MLMNKYILSVLIIGIAFSGIILWYSNMQRPMAMVSPVPSVSVLATPMGSMGVAVGDVKLPMPMRAPMPAKNQGTVTFAIKDKAESLDNFQYILLQLKGVSVHHAGGQWIAMKSTPPLFDLLKLYRSEKESAFLTELNLDAGIYDQIRFDLGTIMLVTKDGMSHEAKIPSKEIKFNSRLIVEKEGKSSVTIDIISAKSIHLTGRGEYIFAPVINLETRSKLDQTQIFPTGMVTIIGGKTDTTIDVGMDENGDMKKDFFFDSSTTFEIIGNIFHVVSKDENEADINITVQQAIDAAMQGGNLSRVVSLKISDRRMKVVWQVRGIKSNGGIATIFIDANTGLVVGME